MKKGIVMEQHRNYSIIMTRDGSFEKAIVLEENATIGEEVSYKPVHKGMAFTKRKQKKAPVRIFSMACIMLILIVPFYFLIGKDDTFAYVTVDINPSIEMEVDENFNVKAIRPLNEDASRIIENLSGYENEKVETVISMIMRESELSGLTNDEKNMIVGISYEEDAPERELLIPSALDSFFSKISGWEVATLVIPKKMREQANHTNASMNEVMATEIMENDTPSSELNSIDQDDKEIIDSFYNPKVDEEEDTSSSVEKETLIMTPVTTQVEEKSHVKTNSNHKPSNNEQGNDKREHPKENASENNVKSDKINKQKESSKKPKLEQPKTNSNHSHHKQKFSDEKMNHNHDNRGNNDNIKDRSHKKQKEHNGKSHDHKRNEKHEDKRKENRHKKEHHHGNREDH